MATDDRNISAMRKTYVGEHDVFTESDLVSQEPFGNFRHWFDIACQTDSILEPNAVSLATASKDGKPSVRMVLLKGFDEKGFTVFTNYNSRKGNDIAENPHVALLFYWASVSATDKTKTWSRQVRIEGRPEKISEEESTKYFHSRPRLSQISAIVSKQSQVVASRKVLKDKDIELQEKYSDESVPIPKPDYWGGYLIVPEVIEFWQGQTTRMHDRIVFRRPKPDEVIDSKFTHQGDDGWVYERLSP